MSTNPINGSVIDYRLGKLCALIADGAELIAQQEALVSGLKEKGRDAGRAEDTLGILRAAQIIFQNYRRDLIEKSKASGGEPNERNQQKGPTEDVGSTPCRGGSHPATEV
jgi:hypothetical protein